MKITLGDKVMFDSCSCCCYYWFMIPLWKCLVSSWVVLKRSEIFVSESETYYEMTRKAMIYKFILAFHIQRCFCNILFKWNKDNQNNIFFVVMLFFHSLSLILNEVALSHIFLRWDAHPLSLPAFLQNFSTIQGNDGKCMMVCNPFK